jgi:hypothetical protein
MAKPNRKPAPVRDVFLCNRYRVIPDGHDTVECIATTHELLSDAIDIAELHVSMFEDCRASVEIWLGDRCVVHENAEDSNSSEPWVNTGPIAPGRYRWRSEEEGWKLVSSA